MWPRKNIITWFKLCMKPGLVVNLFLYRAVSVSARWQDI
jgi:hypothetical protein